MIRYWHLW